LSQITLGVLADTHIPDRARSLDGRILEVFRQAQVSEILHAGDISIPSVLEQLSALAPVQAVRGNRDWVALGYLPVKSHLVFDGVRIGLTHGHGRLWNYVRDRIDYMFGGYRLGLFLPRLLTTFPDEQVVVFGHTHRPLVHWVGSQLIFNPGSAHFPDVKRDAPSVGLLHIHTGGLVRGEIIPLV
jgi:putative phosphoesterase